MNASTAISKQLTIFHFNDVYNIEPSNIEPLGGAARMVTACLSIQDRNPMVLFSGDCLNPSMISSTEKGNQMIPVFKGIGVNCAVLGNHEFDFGLDVLEAFMSKCEFPWLLSNVLDRCTGKPMAGAKETCIINWNGIKVGLLGLAEYEWLLTLPTLDVTDMIFTDFVESGTNLSKRLRQQEGADVVIALTHMSMKNDIELMKQVAGIDIVFGGHDHDYCLEEVDGRYIVKSGSDFQKASIVTLNLKSDNTLHSVDIEELTLDSTVPEDESMKMIVDSYLESFEEMSKSVLGYSDSALDGLFSNVRSGETNLGNLVADTMVNSTGADVAILNSGTLRSNSIHLKGAFTNKDLLRILPLFDKLCVLQVSGQVLHAALENGVSRYPALSGCFPQVSGITFEFDPLQQPGERIDIQTILVNGKQIKYDQSYNVCVKEYIAKGRDGYSMFKECPDIISTQAGIVLSTVLQNFFEGKIRPCKYRGCLNSRCDAVNGNGHTVISHHQVSHNGDIRTIPPIEGRIKNNEFYASPKQLEDLNGNSVTKLMSESSDVSNRAEAIEL